MIRVRSSGGWQTFTPSEFTYGLQDVSASDSGRTQDGLMHKNRITQKVKLNLGFGSFLLSTNFKDKRF